MFEALPFYGGKILSYKQFFFYIAFLGFFALILIAGIVDLALNISLWNYRRNMRKLHLQVDDEDVDTPNEDGLHDSINDSFVKKDTHNKVMENYKKLDEVNGFDDGPIKHSQSHVIQTSSTNNDQNMFELKAVNDSSNPNKRGASVPINEELNDFKDEKIVDEDNDNDENDRLVNNSGENGVNNKVKKRSKIRIMYWFIMAWELIIFAWILLLWDTMNAFDFIYSGALSLIFKTLVFYGLIIACVFRYTRLFIWNNYFLDPTKSTVIKLIIAGTVFVVVFFTDWGMMTLVKGIWIANHNADANGLTFSNYAMTSAIGRYWGTSTWPKDKMPCFMYITLPEDGLSNAIVNFQLNPESWKGICNPVLQVTPLLEGHDLSETEWANLQVTKSQYRLPDHEYESRNIYHTVLNGLEEGQSYAIRVLLEGWDNPTLYTYRNFNTKKMTIINGGDIGNNVIARKINENVLADLDPDVIFVGGDVAYDNGFAEWYQWYDNLMLRMPYLKYNNETDSYRIVPFMFSSGNHDYGVNSNSKHKFKFDDHQPVFKHYYPQNLHNGTIPELNNRKSYFAHKIGSRILFLSLDSGYEVEIPGDQTEWLEQQLQSGTYDFIFAQYHNPIYSACKKGNKGETASQSKKYWVPLFDKYNVTMGFENHVHGFKRTKRIKGGAEDSTGIIYIGDGSWGPLVSEWDLINQDIMEKSGILNHVWIIEIDETKTIKATAYDQNKKILDEFTFDAV